MSNDSVMNAGSGGDRIRDFDDGTRKWPASFIAFGTVSDPGPISSPTVVSATNPLPVTSLQLPAALGQSTMASALSVAIASNQTAIPVSGTVTANAGTGTLAVSLAAIPALGQATMASSLPVVVSSNQTAIPVSGTVTANAGTGTLAVSLAAIPALGQATMASSLPVVVSSNQTAIPVSGTVTANAGTGTLAVSVAAIPALGQATMASSLPVVVSSNQSAIPVSGTITANAGTGTLSTTQNPQTSGGLTIYRVLWPGNATGVTIKTSAGQIYGGYLFNVATTVRFVKLYNKATAPTVGTDTPVMTLCVPAGGGATFNWDKGIAFSSGIGVGVTNLVGDSDTTAPTANDVTINLFYF